jgi:CheY-like chemotaxis protein
MPNHRIMIVEDEALVALNLQKILESLGYEVPTVVYSGEEALLEQVADISPDLGLMDIQLAGAIDGIEAATQIRDRFDIPLSTSPPTPTKQPSNTPKSPRPAVTSSNRSARTNSARPSTWP